ALTEILSKREVRVWMISYFSDRARVSFVRISPRALGKSCSNTTTCLNDFPPKAWRAVLTLSRALGDSFCFGSSPKQWNRIFKRGTRVVRT
ncbi:hypothetical protein, partial [uncultured Rikenella sp.]|uniref:hypothetical protein n=1 Tax=uncultured Rikenella sp. TaxID=368003 RepID=UPI002634A1BF